MLEIRMKYERNWVTQLLGDVHYLIECVMGEEVPKQEPYLVLRDLCTKVRSGSRLRGLELLKSHIPVEVVYFSGLEKYTAEWWIGLLRLSHANPIMGDYYLVLVGWRNNKGTWAACREIFSNLDGAKSFFERKLHEKIDDRGYKEKVFFDDLKIRDSESDELPDLHLPPLPLISWQEDVDRGSDDSLVGGKVPLPLVPVKGTSIDLDPKTSHPMAAFGRSLTEGLTTPAERDSNAVPAIVLAMLTDEQIEELGIDENGNVSPDRFSENKGETGLRRKTLDLKEELLNMEDEAEW